MFAVFAHEGPEVTYPGSVHNAEVYLHRPPKDRNDWHVRFAGPAIKIFNKMRASVSTSHVERLNATTRLHVKRLSRLTLAFSKKLENFQAAVALHFAYYNFVRRHNTLRCTPAMAAGVERDFWTVGDLVEATI